MSKQILKHGILLINNIRSNILGNKKTTVIDCVLCFESGQFVLTYTVYKMNFPSQL